MNIVMLGAFSDFCSTMSGMLKIIGYVLTIFKIVIPLLIVIYGMIDLGKAVVASKDDEIKKAAKQIGIRLAAGILIYFIPSLILLVFSWISDYNNLMNEAEFEVCQTCILHPGQCQATGLDE